MKEQRFRELMDIWEQNLLQQRKILLHELIENQLTFFFSKKNEIFGCPEEGRLTFARLKNPEEKSEKSWMNEEYFWAYNLSRAVKEENIPKKIFYLHDMENIKILDKDQVLKKLEIFPVKED